MALNCGIIGVTNTGKTTLFNCVSSTRAESSSFAFSSSKSNLGVVAVPDPRLYELASLVNPKKTTPATVEIVDIPGLTRGASHGEGVGNKFLSDIRNTDALIHVLRNFASPGGMAPTPEADFWTLEEEMILGDLMVVEKRLERMALDRKRGSAPDPEELSLIDSCKDLLEKGLPIRRDPGLAGAPALRGFTFLSGKPQLLIVNNDDEDEVLPAWDKPPEHTEIMLVRGRLEMDIASMAPEEAQEFLVEYHIEESALDRVIECSYRLMQRISFFTVLNEEVRAWSIPEGSPALEAAGAVHTDMQRGFIRAEVLSFEDLQQYGSFQEAKKAGQVRLEGKEYIVQDGDVINFRFNV